MTSKLITLRRAEYGGQRDILMLPCVLTSLQGRPGVIWRTTLAEEDPGERHVLELLAEVNLRKTFGLQNGDVVEVLIPI